jgi:hypothetical protein
MFPGFSGVGLLDDHLSGTPRRTLCRGGTRRKVLDLVAAGRPVAQVAHDLDISAQVIYTWRRQQLIDSGQIPGMTSADRGLSPGRGQPLGQRDRCILRARVGVMHQPGN